MRTVNVDVYRTEMCGGGTAYDVLVPTADKTYHPIAGLCYATTIHRDGRSYFRLDDFLRTEEIDGLPALTDERIDAFHHLRDISARLEAKIAARAFPELAGARKLPLLWAHWTKPSRRVTVPVVLRDRDAPIPLDDNGTAINGSWAEA